MKVIIRNEETQLYLGNGNGWTATVADAQDFAFSLHAKSVAQQIGLKKYQVLFYFPDLDYKIVVLESAVSDLTGGKSVVHHA